MSPSSLRRPESADTDRRPIEVHRVGAVAFAVVIAAFGVLGFLGGLAFFSITGQMVVGMSSNGLLSTLSLVTALVLVAAAMHGARMASTVMIVVGVLFILSGLVNLALIDTSFNMLAFRTSNVFFSVAAGLVLLLLGAYGRVSGNLPHDNPYYVDAHGTQPGRSQQEPAARPLTPQEVAAEAAMAQTERVVAGAVLGAVPTADQRARVAAMAQVTSPEDRRRVWLGFES